MNYFEKVKQEESKLSALYSRMDDDKGLQYLDKYTMRDKNGKAVPNIINITLPDMVIFSTYVLTSLNKASEQGIVTSEEKNFDTHYVEDFHTYGFDAADYKRREEGGFQLNPFLDEQACIRGRLAARCLFRMGGDVLIPDIALWDTRYVTYVVGEWGAFHIYKTKAEIEKEAWAKKVGFSISGGKGKVLDVWDKEHNEIWVDGKQVFEQKHSYGFCPIVYIVVPLGSMLADEDSLVKQGESIFFLIRDIVPELNRLASMAQSVNMQAVNQALQYESDQGARLTKNAVPEHDEVTAPGAVTAVDAGKGFKPLPIQDIQRAFDRVNSIIESRLQRGGVSSIELGELGSPPPSGIAIIQAKEGRGQVQEPRLLAKAWMKKGLADMFTKQVIQMGGSVELGTPGHKRTFETSKLQGEYETTYKYFPKSLTLDAGLYSLAAAAGNSISEKAKVTEILQREDPDGDDKQKRWEEAERLSPEIKIYRDICSLKDVPPNPDFEAELLAGMLGATVDRMMAGEIEPLKPEKEDEPTQVLSLFGGGAGRVAKEEE